MERDHDIDEPRSSPRMLSSSILAPTCPLMRACNDFQGCFFASFTSLVTSREVEEVRPSFPAQASQVISALFLTWMPTPHSTACV